MADLQVVFGTGPVGLAVMRELLAAGATVRMINRSGEASLPAGVELVGGDAADRSFCREVCRDAAVVYQCAAPPYHRWPEQFPRLQAGVLEGAAAAGARLVVMDNVYLYGSPYGKPLTERRPATAMTRKGRVRAQMATDLLAAHKKGRVPVAIGRASDFFGPGVTESALGARVFEPALAGKPALVLGDINLPHTYSYVPDIARGLVILGRRDEAFGQAWHLPGPETVTTREILGMIYAETGHRPASRRAGKLTLRSLGFFKPEVKELVEMMYLYEEPFVVEHTKFVAAFGDISTPLTEAIRATVDWYRARAPVEEPAEEPEAADATEQELEESDTEEPEPEESPPALEGRPETDAPGEELSEVSEEEPEDETDDAGQKSTE